MELCGLREILFNKRWLAKDGVKIKLENSKQNEFEIKKVVYFFFFSDTYDWAKCINFSLYGTLFVAPTLYGWVRFTTIVWPVTNLKSAIKKAFIEQFTYGPAATASFFFFMSLLEKKTVDEAKDEVKQKLIPTMKVIYIIIIIIIIMTSYKPSFICLSFRLVPVTGSWYKLPITH